MNKIEQEFEIFWSSIDHDSFLFSRELALAAYKSGLRTGLAAAMDSKLYTKLAEEIELDREAH